jgi:hypothetical protein
MNHRDHESQDPATTEKLRAALSRLNTRAVVVPLEVDDAILRTAREHLSGIAAAGAQTAESADQLLPREAVCVYRIGREDRLRDHRAPRQPGFLDWLGQLLANLQESIAVHRRAAWGGVAVMMVVVGVLAWLTGPPQWSARPEDLNADGVVDMLDAFAFARALQHDPTSPPQLDLNRDGVVDVLDVQALAARAVSLEPGGRS